MSSPNQKTLKEVLQNFNPNLPLSAPVVPNNLINTTKDLKNLCHGYLSTEQNIDLFFKILHHTGTDRQSILRKRFWSYYLNAGFISQSWMILAEGARNVAVSDFKLKHYQFASFKSPHKLEPLHAVLLIRLDQLVIAEWSHIGNCRFWFQGNLCAPQLHKKEYEYSSLLEHCDYIQQHYFSSKGFWQRDAAAWMSAKAHIPMPTLFI